MQVTGYIAMSILDDIAYWNIKSKCNEKKILLLMNFVEVEKRLFRPLPHSSKVPFISSDQPYEMVPAHLGESFLLQDVSKLTWPWHGGRLSRLGGRRDVVPLHLHPLMREADS